MSNLAENYSEYSYGVEPRPRIVSSRGRDVVVPKACGHCLVSAKTVADALEALDALINPASPCETCTHQSALRIVVKQFRLRLPRWWVVDGKVVVPIWIVELLKKHPEKFAEPVRTRAA
jgi:hypothetical protein